MSGAIIFINKTLERNYEKKTKFRNKFLKDRTVERIETKKDLLQWSYCISLSRKTKKEYYEDLDEEKVSVNKSFWKTVKPFLSDGQDSV